MSQVCTDCGEEKVFRPAGIKKNGEPYQAFWSCPNWKEHKRFGNPSAEPAIINTKPQNGTTVQSKADDPILLLSDEIKAINERLDALGKYLKGKLGE